MAATLTEQKVAQVLQELDEAKTNRMRDEAALGALQNERKRIVVEAEEKLGCKSLDELKAEMAKIERVIAQVISEAEALLQGGEVF